jgi:hypothetical protein
MSSSSASQSSSTSASTSSSIASTSSSPSNTSVALPTATALPQTGCLVPGDLPIPLQNASSWAANGCSPGFLCKLLTSSAYPKPAKCCPGANNHNSSSLPQYCPPEPACQIQRLSALPCDTPQGTVRFPLFSILFITPFLVCRTITKRVYINLY